MSESQLAAEYSRFQSNYEGESDRSVAILATSYLETYLKRYISKRLAPHKRTDALFKGYSPLATFSAKIDVGYAIGLLPKHITTDLHWLRKIRNEFAHNPEKLDFESSEIKLLCKKISYANGIPRTDGTRGAKPKGGRAIFLSTVFWCVLHMDSESSRIVQLSPAKVVFKEVVDEK